MNEFLNTDFRFLNDWWRYVVGTILVFVGYSLGQLPLLLLLKYKVDSDSSLDNSLFAEFENDMDFSKFGLSLNVGFFMLLLMFVFGMVALYLVVKYLHNKPFLELITSKTSLNYSKILFGFGLWAIMSIAFEIFSYFMYPDEYMMTFDVIEFIPLLIIVVLMLPIQTSFEELFVRGYLMQGMGVYAKHRWVPIFLTSVFFALLHGTNPEVAKYGVVTMGFYYIIAGLFLAIITVMDDSMELALGVHAATNMIGALLITYEGSVLQTDTIFKVGEVKPVMMIIGFLIMAATFIYICHRKYGWSSLSYLFGSKPMHPSSENV